MTIGDALTIVLPNFNLVLVVILIILFVRMFTRKSTGKVYFLPWKLLFAAIMVFVVEEVLTALRFAGLVNYPHMLINGFFEMAIITLFMYMLLKQKEWVVKKRL